MKQVTYDGETVAVTFRQNGLMELADLLVPEQERILSGSLQFTPARP